MYSIGLDYHWNTSKLHILDEHGKLVKRTRIKGHWPKVMAFLRTVDHPFKIAFEATCGAGMLYDRLRTVARQVQVGHPGQMRLIFRCKRKSDRIDAKKIAKLLFLDEIPPAYMPDAFVRDWRDAIEYRRRVVRKRTACKNALRTMLRSRGIVPPKGLWSPKGLAWLAKVELPRPFADDKRHTLLRELAEHEGGVNHITRRLNAVGRKNAAVRRLQTIPGVGPRTAEAVVAFIDNPDRFRRSREVAAYFGLVPCQDASAARNRLGHITKEGPAVARQLLVEATWQSIRRCPHVRAHFERIVAGRGNRRKIAVVGTARWLLQCMFAMLRSGEAWRFPVA